VPGPHGNMRVRPAQWATTEPNLRSAAGGNSGAGASFHACSSFFIEYAAHDSRLGDFSIADLSGLVQIFRWDFSVAPTWQFFHFGKIRIAGLSNFAPLLRGIVFVGEATFGARYDLHRVGLRTVRGGKAKPPPVPPTGATCV